LHILIRTKRWKAKAVILFIASIGYSIQLNKTESARLNAIYAFILEHFKSNLDLKRVAQYAHMTPQAFSRYFKERTQRTFVSFLNEVRIDMLADFLPKVIWVSHESAIKAAIQTFRTSTGNLKGLNR